MTDADSDPKKLTVAAHVVEDRLEIRVTDTGPGISKDNLEKIFEPLFSTRTTGFGLGLPIVKTILEQHGGGVDIQTEEGAGTTITLRIPIPESD
jgi:signal transduction histidine kinase